jgi:glycerophosphoryl diester phosphodiesterase
VGSRRWPFLEAPLPLAFAHRGGVGEHPENSLEGFAQAIALGCTHIETDVHATADGVAVVFHDETLERLTGHPGRLADLLHRELSSIRLRGQRLIPRVEDVLGAFPDVRLNIDVKSDDAVGPLLEAIRRTGSVDRVCVASFSDRRLQAVRSVAGPRLATSMGPNETGHLVALSRLVRLPAPVRRAVEPVIRHLEASLPRDVPCVQVPARAGMTVVDQPFVDLVHEQGRQVHVWTINTRSQMRRLLDLGVDGLVSDDVEAVLAVTRGG